ncbi:MAG: AraC family transcriptional regulator [Devosia sp.]
MGTALAVVHGRFGRASLYRLDKPLAPHAHREGHLVFLVDGTPASIKVDGRARALTSSLGAAVSPWQPHHFQPGATDDPALFLTLYIKPMWFVEMSRTVGHGMRFGREVIVLDSVVGPLVEKIAETMMGEGTAPTVGRDLYDLTMASFEQSNHRLPDGHGNWPTLRDFRIRNAIRLMNDRVADVCALDTIARESGLSRPHFYKLFRENVGLTPNMYLNTLRVERAIGRLTTTGDPITSIGLDLGFASQASFTRFFCNQAGLSPTDFRKVSLMAA